MMTRDDVSEGKREEVVYSEWWCCEEDKIK